MNLQRDSGSRFTTTDGYGWPENHDLYSSTTVTLLMTHQHRRFCEDLFHAPLHTPCTTLIVFQRFCTPAESINMTTFPASMPAVDTRHDGMLTQG